MSLYAAEPILDAVVALLRAELPKIVGGKTVTVAKDGTTVTTGMVLVDLVVSPVPESIHWGGHDWSDVGVQVTSHMATKNQARTTGDLVRAALVAQTRGGQLATPPVIPGHKVLAVTSNADGFADSSAPATGVIYQWAETYTIRFT